MKSNGNTASGKSEQKKKTKKKSVYSQFALAVLKTVVVIFISIGCTFAGILAGACLGYLKSADAITPNQLELTKLTSFIYDSEGAEIAQIKGSENRVVVVHSEIPDNLRNAFIAIEDKNFYNHGGVDSKRFIKAAISYIINLGDASFGGSTITQQLVKNITGNEDTTIKRKVQEAWQAIQLERNLSKDQILDNYMNRITTGSGCYGVQAAAKKFFNKDVKDLSLAECASIAGVTKSPGYYDPTLGENNKKRNKERQEIILRAMLDQGKITQNEYDEAIAEELKIYENKTDENVSVNNVQSYFVDYVLTQVQKDLMEKYNISSDAANIKIYNSGLKIYTTQDSKIQKIMNEEFTNIENFPVNKKISNPDMQAQGAMLVLDPNTGYIRGMYGAYGYKKGNFTLNRATSMKRQPGSSFKPIAVYGPSIDLGLITPATVVDDVPIYLDPQNPTTPYPKNSESSFRGLSTIRSGIRSSINVVAAKVFMDYLGAEKSVEYLKKVNIDRSKEKYVSMALGGLNEGVNPLIMASAYVPFVNNGVYFEPIAYTKVTDESGNIILDKTKEQKKNIVYKETTAFLMTNMMRDVVTSGTAATGGLGTVKNSAGKVIPTAGKTGTTNDNYDKWFVGYSPYYVGATWYGYNNPKSLKSSEYNQSLLLWNKVMNRIHADLEVKDFQQPEGLVKKSVCIYSGKLPGEHCSHDPRGNAIRTEYFVKGTEPKDTCDVHVLARVDTTSKDIYGRPLLANEHCPASAVQERVFIQRPVPYLPKDPSLVSKIKDWIYELPQGEYCTIHSSSSIIGPPSNSTKGPNAPLPQFGQGPILDTPFFLNEDLDVIP
ncbi:PBP1A family penicillin-binding protein [Ruminiclostridium herbifermentans]|uniref:Penicillin-binding protein 1A n=1 Tax=Ruminiclostridium herbifermentans TaxID=2488810 RepID=A0A4V6EQT6_9FIRM|nr:PBP1A family penicillin-binding protein [Ruminiclostridium herbifermentans]QNU66566.1 PBP1A family penicillin-binding protein [Ruminiclostridium herbifermentans]